MKKHYRLITGACLLVIWVAYIVLWQNGMDGRTTASASPEKIESEAPQDTVDTEDADKSSDEAEEPSVTEAPEASAPADTDQEAEPTAEPTEDSTPEPTEEPTPEPTAEPTPEPTEEPVPEAAGPYVPDFAISNVSTSLNIRAEASTEGKLLGSLGVDAWCTVIEKGTEWTKVSSGSITGYASTKFLLFDQAAINRAKQLSALYVEVAVDTLNVRAGKDTQSAILKEAKRGEKYSFIPDKSDSAWIAIQYDASTVAYLRADYVKTALSLESAVVKAE